VGGEVTPRRSASLKGRGRAKWLLENAARELHDDLTMMLVEYRAGTTS
jgi:hypothetical protein